MLKIAAIAEVAGHWAGRRKPVAVLVVYEDAVDALRGGLAQKQERSELCQRVAVGSLGLEATDGTGYTIVQYVETIFGVLRQRSRQVGQLYFGGLHAGLARAPLPPAAHAENGDTNQRNKRRRPKRKTAQAGFEKGGFHLDGTLGKAGDR